MTNPPDSSATDPATGAAADPPQLPEGCGVDGRVVGSRATLLVDPGSAARPADGPASARPVHAVCTDGTALERLTGHRPDAGGTLYLHASVVADTDGDTGQPGETVHGWPVRRVHTAATADLGGLVADVVHLGAGHTPEDLVVSVRAVDERGRPRRDVPPVVYTGLLVNDVDVTDQDAPIADAEYHSDEQMRAWADSLDLVCGLLGGSGLAVTRAGTVHTHPQVDAQRVARLQAAGSSGTGRVGMPPPDWQLPLA